MLFAQFSAFQDEIVKWFGVSGWKVLIIVLVIYIGRKFGNMIITRAVRRTIKSQRHVSKQEEKQREDTIIGISTVFFRILLWVVGGMTILSTLGFEIGPLLASASVVGVALGFGAQSLIKDFVAGLFIIIENQYRVGDVVSLDGTAGLVERISIRETVLRDLDGNVHHVPNGSITIATNMTFEHANVNLDVRVSYGTDIDTLIEVINKVGVELAADPEWSDLIVEPPAFLRVDDLGETAVIAKIVGKTKPLQQWGVTGELRKRLKKAFEKSGIEIPYPQLVIHRSPDTEKNK